MKRKWWVLPIILAVIGVLWIMASDTAYMAPLHTAIGLKPTSGERAKSKPVCTSPVNPNVAAPTDCIPQHLAKLPPDPGEAGKLTIEGIDSDNDGVRDDVQRFIAENWGHSERAVKTLTLNAKTIQTAVIIGDSVTREEARVKVKPMLDAGSCYILALDESVWNTSALDKVAAAVLNTPERAKRAEAFNYQAGHSVYAFDTTRTTTEICGFDPAQLSN
jgi:hypothetical protein